jgi:hypothetical protein
MYIRVHTVQGLCQSVLITVNYALLIVVHTTTEWTGARSSKFKVNFATYGQSDCSSWCQALLWFPWPDFKFSLVWQFLASCRASSLTRGQVCSSQCSHSLVRVTQDPWPYITVSSETPATWRARFLHLLSPKNRLDQLYPLALSSLYDASYDSGLKWSYSQWTGD